LNFIFGIVCLFVCVCAFSLRRESPDMILGDKPLIFEVVLSQNASPSSGLSGASTDERRLRRDSSPTQIHKGSTGEILGRPHVDERWSGSTRAARISTTRGSAADGDCEETR
jgi:hypothetical protein